MLIRMDLLTADARRNGYGVTGTCPMSIEAVKWSFQAAERVHAPLMLCCHAHIPDAMPLEMAGDVVSYYARKYDQVPAALCMDHGNCFEDAAHAIRAGFTGVMVDRFLDPVEENARIVKEAVRFAHSANVSVEAALGGPRTRDASFADIEASLTKVDEAKWFCEQTDVDCLAVAVGSYHGEHKTITSVMHFDLIEELNRVCSAALVMHGTSFMGDENIARAARSGIAKFNVSGDMTAAAIAGGRKALQTDAEDRRLLLPFYQAIGDSYVERTAQFMTLVGSANRW